MGVLRIKSMASDVISCMRQNISHFHTAGNPGRNELDETQELYYPPIMKAIAATDYDGYVGQEFSPKNGADWAESGYRDLWMISAALERTEERSRANQEENAALAA